MNQEQKVRLRPSSIASPNRSKKVLVVVLDGVGYRDIEHNLTTQLLEGRDQVSSQPFRIGNAVNAAYTPSMKSVFSGPLFRYLKAHGPAVGLPSDDDMGNSEVGHNALGAGRVFDQGAKLVNYAIESGVLFKGEGWTLTAERTDLKNGKNTLHFCGLLSDGNVHSHINHMTALIRQAKQSGVKRVRVHALLDGRDVPPTSSPEYVTQLEAVLSELRGPDFDCRIASGGGRMFVTMDRYEADWRIVERGYQAHVLGEARGFQTTMEAIAAFRLEGFKEDQNLPPFVIVEDGKPVGPVLDGDSFIFCNFRGDRAIEISRALTETEFAAFPRKRFPKIHYAGMMQYDGDLHIPKIYLVSPPVIENTMGELLSEAGVKQFACSETQKYGHVTYFWNGNRSGKFNDSLETYVEIPSDRVQFNERPWMKSAEIADETINQMRANAFQVGRINFANGDMVGHTGDFAATVNSISAVDIALGRLMAAAKETDTILVVTSDHGNADELFELDKKTGKMVTDAAGRPKLKTSHTLTAVPFAIYNAEVLGQEIGLRSDLQSAGLTNVASTVLELAGFEAPQFYEPSLIDWKVSRK